MGKIFFFQECKDFRNLSILGEISTLQWGFCSSLKKKKKHRHAKENWILQIMLSAFWQTKSVCVCVCTNTHSKFKNGSIWTGISRRLGIGPFFSFIKRNSVSHLVEIMVVFLKGKRKPKQRENRLIGFWCTKLKFGFCSLFYFIFLLSAVLTGVAVLKTMTSLPIVTVGPVH